MNRIILLSLCFFTFSSTLLFGQYSAPVPVTSTINTPYGPVNHTYYIPGMPYHYGPVAPKTNKYLYTIVLPNDSIINVNAKIDFSDNPHTIKVKVDGQKDFIKPDDTKEVWVTLYGRMKGIAADSCWLFLTEAGPINGYSFIPNGGGEFISAIQDGNDAPILPLTEENLLPLLDGDPKIMKLVKKKRLSQAVVKYNQKALREGQ